MYDYEVDGANRSRLAVSKDCLAAHLPSKCFIFYGQQCAVLKSKLTHNEFSKLLIPSCYQLVFYRYPQCNHSWCSPWMVWSISWTLMWIWPLKTFIALLPSRNRSVALLHASTSFKIVAFLEKQTKLKKCSSHSPCNRRAAVGLNVHFTIGQCI